ncbi:hypothetical protein [Streptomyces sp900116325]|uniref:hypothetical protein n=1 Tax=Streptomyces sp. 900116325 TaxID=3154295 RepID=UPI0033AC5E94
MRMTTAAAVAGLSLLAVLAAGCGSSGSGTARAKPATTVTLLPQRVAKPAPTELEPSSSPPADAPLSENLAFELRTRTLDMAGAMGTTSARCPELGSKTGTSVTCTVTYEGLRVVWDVTIGKKAAWSDNYVQYRAKPRQGLLTRDGVASLLYGNFRPDEVRCNNIPTAVLVPLDVPSTYACQTISKGEPGLVEKVRATDAGPRSY